MLKNGLKLYKMVIFCQSKKKVTRQNDGHDRGLAKALKLIVPTLISLCKILVLTMIQPPQGGKSKYSSSFWRENLPLSLLQWGSSCQYFQTGHVAQLNDSISPGNAGQIVGSGVLSPAVSSFSGYLPCYPWHLSTKWKHFETSYTTIGHMMKEKMHQQIIRSFLPPAAYFRILFLPIFLPLNLCQLHRTVKLFSGWCSASSFKIISFLLCWCLVLQCSLKSPCSHIYFLYVEHFMKPSVKKTLGKYSPNDRFSTNFICLRIIAFPTAFQIG